MSWSQYIDAGIGGVLMLAAFYPFHFAVVAFVFTCAGWSLREIISKC
jgi:hypothetical protein